MPAPSPSARTAALIGCVMLLAGCSAGSPAADHKPTTTGVAAAESGPPPTPRPSAAAALEALLAAEQRGDHTASYALLSTPSRHELRSQSQWERQRAALPAITGYSVQRGGGADTAVALVEHKPGLDPFVGLSPARERQTWKGRREGDGFLLDADPLAEPLLPPDTDAKPVALAWSRARQACDEGRAKGLQAVTDLYGSSTAAADLCHSQGDIAVGDVGRLSPGPSSADIVAQYGTAALQWARTVTVTGPVPPFHAVLAPIGDEWKVIGASD